MKEITERELLNIHECNKGSYNYTWNNSKETDYYYLQLLSSVCETIDEGLNLNYLLDKK